MRQHKDFTPGQLAIAVAASYTMADTLRSLNLPVKGYYYNKVKYKIKELNIDTTHWLGSKYQKRAGVSKQRDLSGVLIHNSDVVIGKYKARLIREGILENKCSICNILNWNGKPLKLHIDHIDGDSFNNVTTNLRLICPNCHSQTETYCKGIRQKKIRKCMDCDRVVTTLANRCPACTTLYKQQQKKALLQNTGKYPPIDELVKMVRDTSYEEVGKKFNVTGAAVKRFIKRRKGDIIPRYNKRT